VPPELLEIPARIRFVSAEPLLSRIDLSILESGKIHQVIIGGESGPKARPCDVDWIIDGVGQCRAAKIPAFVKQLGANIVCRNDFGFDGDEGEWPMDTHYTELDGGYQGAPVRVKLRDKKGGAMEEWPEQLRIREFPSIYVRS